MHIIVSASSLNLFIVNFLFHTIQLKPWLVQSLCSVQLTDTGSNGGVGQSVVAVAREYFYYWSG